MREFELTTEIVAAQERAWQSLLRLDEWPPWNRLMPSARGAPRPGAMLDLRMRRVDGAHRPHRPTVVSFQPPECVVLAAALGHHRLVCMVHSLSNESLGLGRSRLRQTWSVTGLLVPLIWPMLVGIMSRFSELGEDRDLSARMRVLDE